MNTISFTPIKRYRRIVLPSEFKIRKKTLRRIKLLLLILLTGFITFVSYNLMRTYFPKHKIEKQYAMMVKMTQPEPTEVQIEIADDYDVTTVLLNEITTRDITRAQVQSSLIEEKEKIITQKSKEKVDWHNHNQIRLDKERTGPGEQGIAGDFSNISEPILHKLYKENGYNGALSDIISLHRALPDVRPPNCSQILYKKDLLTASVVIPFHNEHFSVLVRTVWSVIDRSPEQLIKDVILVDDFSTKEFLKEELEDYFKKNIPKAKIVRLEKRSGLIVARQIGAKAAKGEVLIFLDAHCEANVNWLPPLLDIITDDYKTAVCPFIDIVDYDTYKYSADSGGRGAFNWNLVYQRLYKFKRYGDQSTEPFESPVMAGGLFAISAKFFWELGGYDEGLFIWGGEQFELSFKIWQCGGRLLDVPCSRVGHMYRKFGAFINPNNNMDYICTNFKRVAEVWMDEYKQYFYMRQPECAKMDHGDISKQVAIRQKLNCKPFKWFMEEVAYDLVNRNPLIDPPDVAYGEVRNVGNSDYCMESTDKEISLNLCSKDSWSQIIQFTWRGEVKHKTSDYCWDIGAMSNNRIKLTTYACHYGAGNQLWHYDETSKNIKHGDTNNCLDMDKNTVTAFLSPCNGSLTQQWTVQGFNKTQSDKIPEYLKTIQIDGK